MLPIILLVLYLCQLVAASTNFQGCFNNLINGNSTVGAIDSWGNSVRNLNDTVGYTYQFCRSNCGPGAEPFDWPKFNQQLTAWLLPWLALISQLPYGANDALSNFEAMIMTVGSPMLAAYSLALVVTSNRWLVKRFRQSTHPKAFVATKILSNLQQVSFTLPKEEDVIPSLIVFSENDQFWAEADEGLDYRPPQWTVAAIMSMVYVGLTYVFTWVSTLQGDLLAQLFASGQSVGSLWLSLLPIVICYLQISPKCEGDRICKVVENANKFLYVATDNGEPEMAEGARAITVQTSSRDMVYEDQLCTTPICFYARIPRWFQTVQQVTDAFEAVSQHGSVGPKEVITKDEVIERCTLLDDGQDTNHLYEFFSIYIRSALLAAFLQWGTTGAAIMALYLTPTRGFGCRSASFTLYGCLSMLIWLLLVISSALGHNYATQRERGIRAKVIGNFAIALRQLAKTLAAVNTTWIILSALFQFSNVFDNCYCNSSRLGLGHKAYAVLHLTDEDRKLTKLYWAGGMIMSSGAAVLYICAINLLRKQPERRR